MNYTIKAIETRYKGHLFRSQLEATWAAFFDLCGWQWEYEPFTLNGWLPDFALIGKEKTILVEVKPVFSFPRDVAEKIEQAHGDDRSFHSMIVGCGLTKNCYDSIRCIGWIREFNHFGYDSGWDWGEMSLRLWDGKAGFFSTQGGWNDRISGEYDGNDESYASDLQGHEDDASYFHALWGRAKEATRYVHGRRSA